MILRHVTDAPTHFVRGEKDIVARHSGRAAGRRQKTGHDIPNRRGFARAVRAEQANNFATRPLVNKMSATAVRFPRSDFVNFVELQSYGP